MRVSSMDMPYLNGERFNEDLFTGFEAEAEDRCYRSRFDVLADLCRGKKVIHIGCVDHEVEAIERKLARGTWLHKRLCDEAARCYGIDIREEGIRYMRDHLGYRDAEVLDILHEDSPALLDEKWDYALLPEVLEHIGNPVAFLSALRNKWRDSVKELVVTVPNAFYRGNFKHATRGRERINSDHRFWFTPYTLTKIVSDAGFSVDRVLLCNSGPLHQASFIHRWYYKRHPMLRNNLVLTGRF